MPRSLRNPGWIDSRLLTTNKIDDLPESFFDETREALSRFRSDNPLVSIVIPALNEEFTIIRTLHSLSCNKTTYPKPAFPHSPALRRNRKTHPRIHATTRR